jgi:hypothetical protein
VLKKLLFVLSFILLIPSILFASNLFYFGIGSISQFQYNLFSSEMQEANVIDVRNWATGIEARSKILGINIDAYMLIQQGEIIDITETGKAVFEDNIAQKLRGMVGIGFSTKAAPITTLSFAVGTLVGLNVSPGFGVETWLGDESNVFQKGEEEKFWSNASLAYRLRVDFNIGSWSLGVHYQVPSSGFSYANHNYERLKPIWDEGKVGASFVTSFF